MAKKKGADNVTMAREGTQYSDPMGRYSLSWPYGGEREILAIPHDERDGRLERRITEGMIEETNDAPNKEMGGALANVTVLTGKAAKEHMAIPVPEEGVGFKAFSIKEEITEEADATTEVEPEPGPDLIAARDFKRDELDKLAAQEDVDIGEAKTKDDVAAAINAKRQAAFDAEASKDTTDGADTENSPTDETGGGEKPTDET